MHQALKESCFLKLPKGNNLERQQKPYNLFTKSTTFQMHIYNAHLRCVKGSANKFTKTKQEMNTCSFVHRSFHTMNKQLT